MRKFTLLVLMIVGLLPLWANTYPYSIDFKTSNESWTAVDNNGDNSTWKWWSGFGAYMSEFTAANDDYVSPAFTMKAGNTYKIKVTSEGRYTSSGELSLVIGKEMKSLEKLSTLTIPTGGTVSDEYSFQPTADGDYYVGVKFYVAVLFGFADPFYLTGVSIEEIVPEVEGEPVFTDDFNRTDVMAGWTAIDANEDNTTWGVEAGAPGITYNGEMVMSSDDWLISPAIPVTQGQDYVVNYTFAQTSAFDADVVEVKAGNAATAEGMTMLLGEDHIYAENGLGTFTASQRLTATEGGNVHVGFHITTAEANGRLALTSITVTPVAKATPQAVTSLEATSDFVAKTVTLTWVNPMYDTENSLINGDLKANVYEDGVWVGTVEGQLPGGTGSYTYAPEQFAGKTTFMVKTVIGENESEGLETTINLDDMQGDLELVHSFANPNASEWLMESLAGTSVWSYSNWKTCFEYDYKLGQKYENDWLISPAVRLESDKRYVAKYKIQTSRSSGNDIAITLGKAQTIQAQTTILAEYKALLQNGFGDYECNQFAVTENGDYYFGIHYTNVTTDSYFDDLEIFKVVPSGLGLEKVWGASALVYNRSAALLNVSKEVARVTLFDAQGRVAYVVENGGELIDLSMLQQGFYIVKADYVNGTIETLKIFK